MHLAVFVKPVWRIFVSCVRYLVSGFSFCASRKVSNVLLNCDPGVTFISSRCFAVTIAFMAVSMLAMACMFCGRNKDATNAGLEKHSLSRSMVSMYCAISCCKFGSCIIDAIAFASHALCQAGGPSAASLSSLSALASSSSSPLDFFDDCSSSGRFNCWCIDVIISIPPGTDFSSVTANSVLCSTSRMVLGFRKASLAVSRNSGSRSISPKSAFVSRDILTAGFIFMMDSRNFSSFSRDCMAGLFIICCIISGFIRRCCCRSVSTCGMYPSSCFFGFSLPAVTNPAGFITVISDLSATPCSSSGLSSSSLPLKSSR
mmetsp:Transcript_22164/g.55887  ORF Transcript_22164/g.55887 Transcript_22164/m.55887 type:complete len:316 (-) Transcript_22164:245-1192(-)